MHRGRKLWFGVVTRLPVMCAVLATSWLYFNGHGRLAFVLPTLVAGLWAYYVYASSIPERGGRSWYAVCDRGLLIRSERLGDTAIPWGTITRLDTIRQDRDLVVFRLTWMGSALGAVTTDIGPATARRNLVNAIRSRAPACRR
ncbi:hypothetical protein [Streptomyces phaeochromogenes]